MDGTPKLTNTAPFSNASSLYRVFDKIRFHDGLVWTVRLN